MVQKKTAPKPVPKLNRPYTYSSGPMTKPKGTGGTTPKRPKPKRY